MIIKIIFYLFIVTGLTYWEAGKLRKKKQMKEMYTYLVIIGITSIIYITHILKVPIPNPLEGVKFIFEPVGQFVEQILGGGAT